MATEQTSSRDRGATPMLVGAAPPFQTLKDRLPFVARAQRTTLITGPTGSGKDVIARALHAQSPRRDRPYVTVHCAALPEALVEAEMFGHSRGAFTGATQTRPGLVRTAEHGTIFLDEVDSLPASAQAKLLRFLETGEYRAVGADHVEHSDAWVIAATNQDLNDQVRLRTFRADLMFRLAVVKLEVPPLAARQPDILSLADHFLHNISDGTMSFADEARRAMQSYDWPGNVRELKHRVESAALFSDSQTIDAAALNLAGAPSSSAEARAGGGPPERERPEASEHSVPNDGERSLERELWHLVNDTGLTLAQAIGQCERMLIQSALRAEGNNRTRAAGRLGIHVRTIFKKLIDG
jgi:DNA-binding NtrC family response regulator